MNYNDEESALCVGESSETEPCSASGCNPIWRKIYSQTVWTLPDFKSCTLGNCNINIDSDNFLNLDLIEDLEEFHFKFVWDDGVEGLDADLNGLDYGLEWTQNENPLTKESTNMNPQNAKLIPSGDAPFGFEGLSISRESGFERAVLDGSTAQWTWYFTVGMWQPANQHQDTVGTMVLTKNIF